MRIRASRCWFVVKFDARRGGRDAALHETRPALTIAEIEKRLRAAKPDLLGEDWRIGGA